MITASIYILDLPYSLETLAHNYHVCHDRKNAAHSSHSDSTRLAHCASQGLPRCYTSAVLALKPFVARV